MPPPCDATSWWAMSMYSELLCGLCADMDPVELPASKDELVVVLLQCRRRLKGHDLDEGHVMAEDLALELDHDRMLLRLCQAMGIESDPRASSTRWPSGTASSGCCAGPAWTSARSTTIGASPSVEQGAGPRPGSPVAFSASGSAPGPAARLALRQHRRIDGRLGAPAHAELGEQARDVVLDRGLGQEEVLGDLAVRLPCAISSSTRRSWGVRTVRRDSASWSLRSRSMSSWVSAGSSSDMPWLTRRMSPRRSPLPTSLRT